MDYFQYNNRPPREAAPDLRHVDTVEWPDIAVTDEVHMHPARREDMLRMYEDLMRRQEVAG